MQSADDSSPKASISSLFEPGTAEADRVQALTGNGNDFLTQLIYSKNRWVEERLVRFGLTNERFALKVFFMVERLTKPDKVTDEQWKHARKARQYAWHEEFEDAEYFPLLFVKYDPEFALARPEDERSLRYVYPARDEVFTLPTEDRYRRDIVRWTPEQAAERYAISRRLYDVRDRLTVTQEEIRAFLQEPVDGRSLFHEIKAHFLYYADIDERWATVLALWVMGTHVFQLFPSYPYVYLWAEHGSGKSRILKVAASMAHMGKHVEDPSAASSFRLVDAINAVLCIDEADKLTPDQNAELLGILNTGYEVGATIPRYNVDKKMLEEFNAYSPKMLASNRPLGAALESRCIRIPITRSSDQRFVVREPKAGIRDSILRDVRLNLSIWAIDQGSQLFKLDPEAVFAKYAGRFADTPIRLFQIMLPLLCIYEFLDLDEGRDSAGMESQRDSLARAIADISEEKRAQSIPDADMRVLVALYDACALEGVVTMSRVQDKMELEEDERKRQFSSSRVGTILRKYAVPKRGVHGKAQYYPYLSTEERLKAVDQLLKKYSVDRSELDRVLREAPAREEHHDGLYRYNEEGIS